MNPFSWFKTGHEARTKIKEREEKLEESQQFLIDAAVAINDVTGALTDQIRRRYEHEMRFEATSAVIEDALIICSLNEPGLIQYANEAAQRDFGSGLTKLDVGQLFAFADKRKLTDTAALFNNLFVAERPLGVHRNGRTFPIQVNMERLDWVDKTASMMILVRRAGAPSSPAADLTFDGILVVQDDHIVAANPSIQAIFGYDNVSLLGQALSSLFPKEKADRIRMVSENGERHLIGTHDDGRPLHLKLATVHVSKMFDQITARLVTVKPVDVDETSENYKMVADNGIDMVVNFTPDGIVRFANTTFARIYGVSRGEIIGRNLSEILPPEEYQILQGNMHVMSPEKPSLRVQLPHARDGQPTALHDWIWHAHFDRSGQVLEFQRTGRDISEIVSNIVTSGYF